MERRQFIRIVGLGVATATLTSILSSCSEGQSKLDYGWSGPAKSEVDIRLILLSYAILAPNPHNKQPWLVKLIDKNSFSLFVDQTRLLPETDPIARQIHIGQGCFLENLTIAASHYGYEANIDYFPEGEYSNTIIENKPVARITLIKNSSVLKDPLYKYILVRQSNKREYDNSRLTKLQKSTLMGLPFNVNSGLNIVDSDQDNHYLHQLLTEAMQVESNNRLRDLETIKMFRFNDQEIQQYRDGFGLSHAGVSGMKKMFAETFFLNRTSTEKDTTSFAKQSVDITQSIALSTSTFALLSTTGNSRLQQVQAGRDYCRLNLTTTSMGLAQHPMSQVLQEYDDMNILQKQFKQHFNIGSQDTVQMLVRLGKTEKTEHTPRRLIRDLLIS